MPNTTDSISSLRDLAIEKFFEQLTDAEEKLFDAIARHEVAHFGVDRDELNEPVPAEQWKAEHTLKADRLVWLLTTPKAVEFLGFQGLRIAGAKIKGEFNLEYATVSAPIIFDTCAFAKPLKLQSSRLRTLQLKGTHVPGICANEMRVEDSVDLSDGFVAFGNVSLKGVKIEGNLNCINGFEAQGQVNLCGASIGGQLNCTEGKFINPEEIAINADSATIASDVFLRDGFEAQGEVNLDGASIGGYLNCDGGVFDNLGACAISAVSAKIAADISLGDGFEAQGEVNLDRASIGGYLNCGGGKFHSPGKVAINADSATIASNVFLGDGFEAQGEVNLRGASIGGQLNCTEGKFINPEEIAINADAATIASDVFLRDGFEAKGEVNLLGASIGGRLDCGRGKFHSPENTAINADSATIASNVFLRDGFEAQGRVNLFRASIGGNFQCNGHFLNGNRNALDAGSTTIGGSVLLGRSFVNRSEDAPLQVEGKVTFLNATIDDRFELNSIKIVLTLPALWWKWYCEMQNDQSLKTENLDLWRVSLAYYLIERTPVLDLRFAKTNIFSFYDRQAEESWLKQLKPGQLCLNGFVYNTINTTNDAIKNRDLIKWLRLQIKSVLDSQTDDDNFALQPYEQLAAVLKANGHQEAATEMLIAKEDDRRRYGGLNLWGKFLNGFLGITIDHGYRPQKALLYSLIVILIGWGIFTVSEGLMTETNDKHKSYAVFNPLMYSFDTFTPVIDLHQENIWLPDASKGQEISLLLFKTRQGELLRIYFWFQIIAGWILTSLWVAGFTGLVRNQQ